MSVSISGDGSLSGVDQGLNVVGVVTATTLNVGTGASISSPATNVLTFGVNNTEKVRINTTGVGIGTTNPDQLLSIQSTGDAQISFKSIFESAEANFARNEWGRCEQLRYGSTRTVFFGSE